MLLTFHISLTFVQKKFNKQPNPSLSLSLSLTFVKITKSQKKVEIMLERKPTQQTVFVVDDDPGICEVIAMLLTSIDILPKCYHSGEAFLEAYNGEVGCLILDIRMKGMSGLKLQEHLLELDYYLPIIFITGHGDIPMAVRAMKLGAVEFLSKPFNNQELLETVQSILEIRQKEQIAIDKRKKFLELSSRLTPREAEVVQEVVSGKLSKNIASKLGISIHTIELHRTNIMKKLEVKSLGELINLVLKNDISPRK